MFKLVVLSCVMAVASAISVAPLGWAGRSWGSWAGSGIAAPLATPWAAPLGIAAPVGIAAPLGVASPVLGAHVIHKRSAVLAAAPLAWAPTAGARIVTPLAASPVVGAWDRAAPWGQATAWGAPLW